MTIPSPALIYAHQEEVKYSICAARKVVPLITSLFGCPKSVIDVGGGTGAWLREFKNHGVEKVVLFDLPSVSQQLLVDPSCFQQVDLTQTMPPECHADITLCLECAEHLPETMALPLVRWLTRSSDLVIFSAAVPGQLGVSHIHCAPSNYWAKLFEVFRFRRNDILRPSVIHDQEIAWWYRQNILVYSKIGSMDDRRLQEKRIPDMLPDEFELVHHTVLSNPFLFKNEQPAQPGIGKLLRQLPLATLETLKFRLRQLHLR